MSKLFSKYPIVKLNGFDGEPDSIVADAKVYNDPRTVADDIQKLYGCWANAKKIKKIFLKYQLCGTDVGYGGYYDSQEGVRGAFQVWSFDLDELEVKE